MQKKLVVAVFLSIAAASRMWAQSVAGQGGISGTVHDPSGAVVPNAKVVISTASHGEVRSTSTNAAGIFAAPALPPGAGYEVTVTSPASPPMKPTTSIFRSVRT